LRLRRLRRSLKARFEGADVNLKFSQNLSSKTATEDDPVNLVLDQDLKIGDLGTQGKEGQGKEGTTVALTVLLGPFGLIKHGKNVDIKEGTPLLAYTDENFDVPASR
jgi:hypothetical protein